MFVLSLVLSCDALMAGPVMRAGALRLNTNSTSTSKSTAAMNNAISTAKTEINSTINTVKNAVIGIAGNAAVTFDNVSAPNCTTENGCVVDLEWKPGGGNPQT